MLTIDRRPYSSLPEITGSPMRSDRLLRGMQKVFGHDLPNQMVVLQGLLQLLDEEESSQLSAEGREYVRRLQNATRRASDMVRFLKEMARLNAFVSKSETIALTALARELQGELQHLYPGRQFEFDWHWQAPALVGDTRVFVRAILELCACFMNPRGTLCRVSGRSERHSEAIELTFHLDEMSEAAPLRWNAETLEQRMEIILAREWLTLCGAGVEVLPTGTETSFSIVIPNR